MFFMIADETIDQKRVRLLGQLRDADDDGSIVGKIESLLTGTERDRDVPVAVSMVYNSPVVAGHRRRGASVREGGREGNRTNQEKARERRGAWLPGAVALKRHKPDLSDSSIAHHVERRHGIPHETARTVLRKHLRG
jgi:hypothetical protein